MRASCLVVLFLWLPGSVQATVYYSGEKYQQLPSSWPGFLMDHRALRMVGISLSPKTPPSLLRQEYQSHYERLIGRRALLNADELADLGALALRLGKTDQALDVLRPAARQYPKHFTLQANLASAWHMAGQWQEAFEQQQLVLGLAPVESQAVERLHLKLMHGRRTSGTALDDLFGVHYSKDNGHRLGRLTAEEQKKLPVDAVAMTQRLALSFPLDARLLWQLGELAAIHGDPATAGQLMDQCVGELGWSDP
ncbi:MAG TPA: tetratricopeptide repeat protein, partial [Gemmatales bacterium]|nr:tetratricopeptide repeat protein [Gemmatales bacterium]